MAIAYKSLKAKLENEPLNEVELEIIGLIEAHLDSVIIKEFDNSEIHVEEPVLDFRFDPTTKKSNPWPNIKSTRKQLMKKELMKRFENAGWKWEHYMDDGLDGPNMSGPDYWILKGKGK